MDPSHHPNVIDASSFDALLDAYPSTVSSKLDELEKARLETIPAALEQRKSSDAYLEKSEVQTLVDWKLSHGTFRPSLKKLVASNSEEAVETTTKAAYGLYAEDKANHGKALKELATLRGIGPATASLLLSVYDPATIPFFSDELYRWIAWDSEAKGKGKGWERKIGYTAKEYEALYGGVEKLRESLEKNGRVTTALECEKVAYVLGRNKDEIPSMKEEERVDRKVDEKKGEREASGKELDDEAEEEEKPARKRRRKG
ncbi:hypothetical protein M8818_003497 [Zalaria obscura]|uniref:Uncharacterized protein n=1 Tax=Zalaria obscura TaxID=2024903 RepID=A0ACC3SGD1_9PEZI